MTIEEILDLPPGWTKSISEEEWNKRMEPFLKVTRPDRIVKPITQQKVSKNMVKINKQMAENKVQAMLDMFEKKFGGI